MSRRAAMAAVLAAGAGLVLAAFAARRAAANAERAHPPAGRYIDIDGTRLHYLIEGTGPPVVLLHGAGMMIQDWMLAGFHEFAARYRTAAFDRPGHGYSTRRGRGWTPERQAALLVEAWLRLGLERPVVVGHSWGAATALAAALCHPDRVAGLVLVSGPYYPERRADVPILSQLAAGPAGAILRRTVLPPLGRAAWRRIMARLFAPNPLPQYFDQFPRRLALRPSHLFALGDDFAELRRGTAAMCERYGEIRCPVVILAGSDDRIVNPERHAARLHRDIAHSKLRLLDGVGHMLHHVAPDEVMKAVEFAWADARAPR